MADLFNEKKKDGSFRGDVKCNEPLALKTTMKVGGNADLFVSPTDSESLVSAVQLCRESGVDYAILGGGSNVIVSDQGFGGAVISTRKLDSVTVEEAGSGGGSSGAGSLRVEAGASWAQVNAACKKHNLGGFEPFTGLSGTVGGALYMNATCFGLSAADALISVDYFDCADGKVHRYEKDQRDWGYKRSPFQMKIASGSGKEGGVTGGTPVERGVDATEQAKLAECGAGERLLPSRIILSALFSVGGPFNEEKSRSVLESRKEKGHFRAPSAGSTFKNPEGLVAGKLIDECGLKGFSVGGAQIAPWHGNFVINRGNATAADIQKLMEIVREKVLKEKGVELEAEVIRF